VSNLDPSHLDPYLETPLPMPPKRGRGRKGQPPPEGEPEVQDSPPAPAKRSGKGRKAKAPADQQPIPPTNDPGPAMTVDETAESIRVLQVDYNAMIRLLNFTTMGVGTMIFLSKKFLGVLGVINPRELTEARKKGIVPSIRDGAMWETRDRWIYVRYNWY
jgi:hypothetical protein